MKTISILSASFLALLLYAFSPKPVAGSVAVQDSTVIKIVQANTQLIQTNNEIIKETMGIHYWPQAAVYDSTSNRIALTVIPTPLSQ